MDILVFCRKRDIATEGFSIRQIVDWNRRHTDQTKVLLHIGLPAHFPAKYVKTITKAVDNCLVARLGQGLNQASFVKSISRFEAK